MIGVSVRRIPVVATALVTLAILAMIGLGVWQLFDRLPKKEAFLAQLAANPARPPVVFPHIPNDTLLFRRTVADCRAPIAIRRAGAGAAGFRLIATCADGMQVQLGKTRDPAATIAWPGGRVAGYISHAPDARPLIAGLFDSTPTPPMLILDTSPAGLAANGRPDLTAVPNNHLAYGVQWFVFAAIAGIIYMLALRRRRG